MKLYVDHKYDDSGKGKFLTRLKPELEKLGVKFTDFKSCDIVLGINKYRKGVGGSKKRKIKDKKKRVLRVDGIHLVRSRRNVWANRVIKQDIERSHAVIWQSEFCKRVGGGVVGKGKRPYVIWNGADVVKKINLSQYDYPKNVILAAKWYSGGYRHNKRLHKMFNIAVKYVSMHNDVCFHVFGKTPKLEWNSDRIVFHGHVDEDRLRSYMAQSDCMLYVAHFDWCPNTVVECLCSGTPVICGNNGGQAEFCPVVIDIDKPLKAKMFKNKKPPDINSKDVFKALDEVLYGDFKWELNPELKIENTAKNYLKVFKDVLK